MGLRFVDLWLKECGFNPEVRMDGNALYRRFCAWCRDRGFEAETQALLSRTLGKVTWIRKETTFVGTKPYFTWVGLVPPESSAFEDGEVPRGYRPVSAYVRPGRPRKQRIPAWAKAEAARRIREIEGEG